MSGRVGRVGCGLPAGGPARSELRGLGVTRRAVLATASSFFPVGACLHPRTLLESLVRGDLDHRSEREAGGEAGTLCKGVR